MNSTTSHDPNNFTKTQRISLNILIGISLVLYIAILILALYNTFSHINMKRTGKIKVPWYRSVYHLSFYSLTFTIVISRMVNYSSLARLFNHNEVCDKVANYSNDVATYSEILLGFV